MKKLSFTLLLISTFILIKAQNITLNDVIEVFNKGVNARQVEDYEEAIKNFNEALKMAKELGDEAIEIRENCEKILPVLHFQVAANLLKEKKNKEALARLKTAYEISTNYENEEIKIKSSQLISQIYYTEAVNYYKNNKFDSSLYFTDECLKYNPENYKAYQLKVGIYKELKDPQNVYTIALRTIELANKNNDKRTADNTMSLARDFLLKLALDEKNKGNFNKTIELTNMSLDLDSTNATAYYLLSQTYTAQKNWKEVIKVAKEGLKYEKNTSEDKAKFYNELGNAYMNLNNKQEACEAFKNAAFGPFKEYAEYQIKQVLKCQ